MAARAVGWASAWRRCAGGVADPPFEAAQRLLAGLSPGDFLVVVGASVAVRVADLGDGGHVQGVAVAPVAAQRQPVDFAVAGGDFDRGGAVAGGEAVPGGEPDLAPPPITVAAMTGPMPKMPVTVVPEALTAMASFFLDSRIWASRRRMSSRSSAASSQRACPAAPDGWAELRMRAAWAAVISSGTPPGTETGCGSGGGAPVGRRLRAVGREPFARAAPRRQISKRPSGMDRDTPTLWQRISSIAPAQLEQVICATRYVETGQKAGNVVLTVSGARGS